MDSPKIQRLRRKIANAEEIARRKRSEANNLAKIIEYTVLNICCNRFSIIIFKNMFY